MYTIFGLIILIMSAVIHEVSHGYVANALGDPTAKYAGRLTLNPLKHLDPFGSIILPLMLLVFRSPVIFGSAKPVPINPNNFKNSKRDTAIVGIAGPLSNFVIAFIFTVILRFLPVNLSGADILSDPINGMGIFLGIIVLFNIVLGVFNLILVPPLDGSRILMLVLPFRYQRTLATLEAQPFFGIFISLFIAFYIVFPYIISPLISLALGKWAVLIFSVF